MDKEGSVQRFLELIRRSHRGKFKVYIGMSAGVGKTYRMLQEAHQLLDAGVDVCIGYIETHGRAETEALAEGLPFVPRRRLFYKGKELEEMDTQAILNLHPEIVVVDELAHTNIEGSGNPKRWQDVMQHIEGLNESVQEITGIEVRERVPDSVLATADEVVNIDLTADELIERLKAGKIYRPDKVAAALNNFFTQDNILQLRELALKEVAADRIPLANQRYLINNLNLATELGGEIRQIHSNRPVETIVELCREQKISIVCTGRPEFSLFSLLKSIVALRRLIGRLSLMNIDLYIMS